MRNKIVVATTFFAALACSKKDEPAAAKPDTATAQTPATTAGGFTLSEAQRAKIHIVAVAMPVLYRVAAREGDHLEV